MKSFSSGGHGGGRPPSLKSSASPPSSRGPSSSNVTGASSALVLPGNKNLKPPSVVLETIRSASNSSNAPATASTVPPGISFADLIVARESQQRQLRENLERRNRELQMKLGVLSFTSASGEQSALAVASPSRDVSQPEGGGVIGTVEAGSPKWEGWDSPNKPSSVPDAAAVQPNPADASTGESERMMPVGQFATANQLMEVLRYVSDMKESIQQGQENDAAMLQSLQAAVERNALAHESRIAALEARHSEELQRYLAQVEGQQQTIRTLQEQVESLQKLVADLRPIAMEQAALERCLETHQVSIQALQAQSDLVTERVGALEHDARQGQRRIDDVRQSVADIAETVERSQSMLHTLKDETLLEQKERLSQLLETAEVQVESSGNHLSRLQLLVKALDEDMEGVIVKRMATVEAQWESKTQSHFNSTTALVREQQAQLRHDLEAAQHLLHEEWRSIVASLESRVEAVDTRYGEVVEKHLKDISDRADAHEAQRRLDYPAADVDRIQLMVDELEGAAAIIDGIAKQRVLPGHLKGSEGRNALLQERIDTLESMVLEMEARTKVMHGPKICFSVDTQAGPLHGPHLSPVHQQHDRVERHLSHELDMAAASVTSATSTTAAAASTTASLPNHTTNALGSNHLAPPIVANKVRQPSPCAVVSSVLSPPAKLEEVITERKRREAAAAAVQSTLRAVQQKFQELSAKEHLAVTTPNPSSSQSATCDKIAAQKAAVFEKERALVEHRNRLWLEIAALEEQEQQLIANKGN